MNGIILPLTAETVAFDPPPPAPGREAWTFREELAQPEPPPRFSAPASRAMGEYWVSNRISRCYFGPIKRPPLNHDELMDDIDYYPRPYLARLQREGVNGLWLTVEWRDLAQTSFTPRVPDAERRLAKLRRTVDRCLEYGIKTWIFCIEPRACKAGDPLLKEHPEMFGAESWGGRLFCPFSKATQQYIEESVQDIFSQVPRLGGIMMISHGERPTTCLSNLNPVTGQYSRKCPRCADAQPWQIHEATASAIMRGIRAAGSSAEYISWFYQPQTDSTRASWVAEVAEHLPDGVTLAYNFESGALREQLGRVRTGGDYWLSYVGPAQGFRGVAEAGRRAGAPIGAKIQVCCSHEVATVPYVPVPGLLYRKYRAMREMGVSTVLQCWYFGNYPGLMNEAAGLLSRETFTDGEDAFLQRLAAPYWGPDSARVADIWRRFSDAYAEYPMSNDMQYYGPFHAGVAWPLLPEVRLLPLARTWKPHDPPSGDTIGECLENHTIEEAAILADRMAKGVRVTAADGRDELDVLAERWKDDPERIRDLGVMKALAYQFESGANVFSFYSDRATAIYESRVRHDNARALAALRRMERTVDKEESVTRRLLPLARADSRLGFHSEAETHLYYPAKLEWRLHELQRARTRLAEIAAALEKGESYPLSEHERRAPFCAVGGDWTVVDDDLRFKVRRMDNGDLTFLFRMREPRAFTLATLDAAGVSMYRRVTVSGTGPEMSITLPSADWGGRDDRRPGWLQLIAGRRPLWPATAYPDAADERLNLAPMCARIFGRLVFPESSR